MNHLKKSDPQAMKKYRKLKKYWRTILKKNRKINYSSLKQYPLFQRKYLTESEVLDYLLSIDEHLRTSYDVYQNLLDAFDTKDYKDFYERIDHLPTMLDPTFKKSGSLLKQTQTSDYQCVKIPLFERKT